MCGRYSLASADTRFRKRFGYQETSQLALRYNIAPTQDAAVVLMEREGPQLTSLRWGLIPFWAKDESIGNKLINARSETLAEKPAFRTAFTRRRCLVLADGFYEWARDGTGRQPVRIVMADREPFAFAGLWDRWKRADGTELRTFSIITTDANQLLSPVHNRMPVILDERDWDQWLDPKVMRPEDLRPLLRPYASEPMAFYPIDRLVNSPAHDCPACLDPLPLRRPSTQPQPGQIVRVHHCEHAYRLPDGLETGAQVKLISFEPGAWTVDANGRRWSVSMTCIDPGAECFVAGQWWHASHPMVQAEIGRLKSFTKSSSKSAVASV
jgi:putative SOS response-associated peptidase YedK